MILEEQLEQDSISIHALLAESDNNFSPSATVTINISIHALLAESDATLWVLMGGLNCNDFYPRSPCGERHLRVLDGSKSSIISIHALLAESDSRPRALKSRR